MKMKLLILAFFATLIACSTDTNKNTESAKFATRIDKSNLTTSSTNEQILAAKLDNKRYQIHLLHLMAMESNALLPHEMKMEYIAEANTLILYFPQNQAAPVGKVTFLNPLKTDNNRIFELKTDPSKRMFILLDNFEKGVWKVKVEWQGEATLYTQEESISIEPNELARPIHK